MARIGVDFGTTNTVAVAHDRGLFSVVLHKATSKVGTIVQETFPSAILIDRASGNRYYGIEADRRFGQLGPGGNHVFLSSLKRHLRDYSEGQRVEAADGPAYDVAELLRGFLTALGESIRASLGSAADEPLESVITWPANANGAQRHITRRCFQEAGFDVIDTLNEPTASAIELADCHTSGRDLGQLRGPSAVAVFDLGGGTFDASVVWVDGDDFRVLASSGISDLGGDDFDSLLLGMFFEKLGAAGLGISPLTRHALLRQARSQKEGISAGAARSLFLNPLDFGIDGRPVSIPVQALYERLRPHLRRAVEMLRRVLDAAADREPRLTSGAPLSIYLVGGSSKLPLVAEMVSAAFPDDRVVLTDKPFTSVAMGAAVSAADRVTYRDIFARHFGLIRLRDHGRTEIFDPIFPAGTSLPRRGEPPLEKAVWYHPRHNIGHLRYLECTSVGANGLPDGDVRDWTDIHFPYDPAVPMARCMGRVEILPTDRFCRDAVCEVYRCDSDGVITVELRRPACGDARIYEIFRD